MTTSQQPRYGRPAGPNTSAGPAPSVPAQRVPGRERAVRASAGPPAVGRALSVGEYVEQTRDAGSRGAGEPRFGEWPYGPRKPETAGPNPYLASEGDAPDVTLPPGGWPGTAALLIGAAGVALATAPTTAVVVWPLTILGVVLGVLGVGRVRAGTARNGVAAVVGTVFCLAGLALCTAWIAMFTLAGLNTAPPVDVAVQAPAGIVAHTR